MPPDPCRRFILPVVVASLLALTAACGGKPGESRPQGETTPAAPRAVRLVEASEGRLPRTVTVTGTLAADEEVVAAFKVAGRVSEIAVDLGTPVRKGQPIARLDPTDYRHRVDQADAALRQVRAGLGLRADNLDDRVDPEKTGQVREARAVLDEAKAARNRMSELLDKGFVSKADYEAASARLQVAEGRHQAAVEDVMNRLEILAERRSALALAKQALADTELRSPIDGAVREKLASTGVYLAEGAPVVGLVRLRPLRLRVAVPERDAAAIRVGQVVRIRPEGDGREQAGRVTRLSPAIQEKNRTLAVEVELPNTDGKLRPGAFARAEIEVESPRPVVMVPAASIVTFAGIERVLGVKDGKAVEKRVRTGRRSGELVEVVEGLAAGERVVVEPGNLAQGQPVALKP
jgi:RND family efflux transporter MFP subunit